MSKLEQDEILESGEMNHRLGVRHLAREGYYLLFNFSIHYLLYSCLDLPDKIDTVSNSSI